MKLPLPTEYSYKDIAEVKNDILHIHRIQSFERLMYDLTYSNTEVIECYYCSKPLNRNSSTLDHMYPRDLGGPSIPNNLCFSCRNCNSYKSNMTANEFKFYLSLPFKYRDEYARSIISSRHLIKKIYSPIIPESWFSYESIDKIIVHPSRDRNIKGKSYKKVEKNYKKYNRLYRPVIVDKNFKLLDGFNTLVFAQENSITEIPTIILENVELD